MNRKFVKYDPKVRQVARMLRKNSTLAEILLWKELKGKQVFGYDFHRQKPIEKYVVDFFCPRLNLAIEIDGSSHDNREPHDALRQHQLERTGITFLRFPDEEIKQNIEGVIHEIEAFILKQRKKTTHP